MFETDETLIRRILQGKDREAGELLVERHYKRIYKEIYLKTSDEELAKDLTQEAFIQILKNLYILLILVIFLLYFLKLQFLQL